MGEIKFRVWDTEKYISLSKAIALELIIWQEPDGTALEENYDNVCLEQYTGLKDKNGKEIYKGDVVNIGEDRHAEPCEVIFSEGCFCVKASWTDKHIELNNYCNDVFIGCVEIIGNIHEVTND